MAVVVRRGVYDTACSGEQRMTASAIALRYIAAAAGERTHVTVRTHNHMVSDQRRLEEPTKSCD